jgi:regulator of PEP synthase PpsR (kinase-PPPase family)
LKSERIDALNFTMAHDDGHLPEDLNDAVSPGTR